MTNSNGKQIEEAKRCRRVKYTQQFVMSLHFSILNLMIWNLLKYSDKDVLKYLDEYRAQNMQFSGSECSFLYWLLQFHLKTHIQRAVHFR